MCGLVEYDSPVPRLGVWTRVVTNQPTSTSTNCNNSTSTGGWSMGTCGNQTSRTLRLGSRVPEHLLLLGAGSIFNKSEWALRILNLSEP